jgi:hypothetical protein
LKGLKMKYTKTVLMTAIALMVSMTFAYAGDQKACEKKACDKKCPAAVKACSDANSASKCAMKKCSGECKKQCAKKESNIKCEKKCEKSAACSKAAANGEKKGWFSFLGSKSDVKKCSATENKECKKASLKKCPKADPNQPTDPNAPKCMSKICKRAAAANEKKAAEPAAEKK